MKGSVLEFAKSSDSLTGDTVQFSYYNDSLHIQVDEPWAGDSESGFGCTGYGTLTEKQAVDLLFWLAEQLRVKIT